MRKSNAEFFLGSKTAEGFVSLFGQLQQPQDIRRLYILKGGPGSGKSTIMRKVGTHLAALGHTLEWIPCASDPQSLDAVVDHTTQTAILDGTAPHVVDPIHPGAVETVINASLAWDEAALAREREAIVALTSEIDRVHGLAGGYVAAAGALLNRCRRAAAFFVDRQAVNRWAAALAGRLRTEQGGGEQVRLLSAVSVGEITFFDGTLRALCDTVYTVCDPWGAASEQLLRCLRQRALALDTQMISCHCSVQTPEKLEHLIFPQDRLAVSTCNQFHTTAHGSTIAIEGLSLPLPSALGDDLRRCHSDAQGLLAQACALVARGKALHDQLEHYYISAMDFDKLDTVYQALWRGMASS